MSTDIDNSIMEKRREAALEFIKKLLAEEKEKEEKRISELDQKDKKD